MKSIAAVAILLAFTLPFALAANPHAALTSTPTERLIELSIEALREGTAEQRAAAAKALIPLGPKAARAVPALILAFEEFPGPTVGRPVAEALAAIGPAARAALPALIKVVSITTADQVLLHDVSKAIVALGDPANPAMIRTALAFQPGWSEAPETLNLGVDAHIPARLPAIAACLQDANAFVRLRAAITLTSYAERKEKGKASGFDRVTPAVRRTALAALHAALDDTEDGVRGWASAAILHADPTTISSFVPEILTRFREGNSHGVMVKAVISCGPAAARVLLEHLGDPCDSVRNCVISTLSQMSADAWPIIAKGLRDRHARVRAGVLEAMAWNSEAGNLYRLQVVACLDDQDRDVRLTAAETLVSFDRTTAEKAIPQLVESAGGRNRQDRVRALRALKRLGKLARPAMPALLRLTRHSDLETRFVAAVALTEADPKTGPTVVPVFIAVLMADIDHPRYEAVKSLRDLGPVAKAALPALRTMLANQEIDNRIAAVEAIARIDPVHCDDAILNLAGLVSDTFPNGGDWRQGLERLRRIGPRAKAAIPTLLEVMKSSVQPRDAADVASAALMIDPTAAPEAVERFRSAILGEMGDDGDEWLDRLSYLGRAAKPLMPALIEALASKQEAIRDAAISAIAGLGPHAKDTLPALRALEKTVAKQPERLAEAIKRVENKK